MLRARLVLLGIGGILFAAGFAVQACGSTDPATTSTDAGPDVLDTGAGDAADVDAAVCPAVVNIDKIPDASIADGASTSGVCLGCVQQFCSRNIEACNASCDCQAIVGTALDCFLRTSKATLCAAPVLASNVDPNTRQIGLGLVLCVNSNCNEACALSSFTADGGADDAGDGGD
jgi:hypothetical protein